MVDRIVWSSLSVGRSCSARAATPQNSAARIVPVQVSTVAACLASGGRKAGTPFEMASTPDSAIAPDEKARISRNSDAPPISAPLWVNWSSDAWSTGSGSRPPNTVRTSP
jgi:hypothetical protein